jgi:hypothetical protein
VRGVLNPSRHHKGGYKPFKAINLPLFGDIFIQLRVFMPHSTLGGLYTPHTQCGHSFKDELVFLYTIKPPSMNLSPQPFRIFFKYGYHYGSPLLGSLQLFKNFSRYERNQGSLFLGFPLSFRNLSKYGYH